jgi:hypothetical protein
VVLIYAKAIRKRVGPIQGKLDVKLNLGEHALSSRTNLIVGEWIKQCVTTHKCDTPLSKATTESSGVDSGVPHPFNSLNPLNTRPTRLIRLNSLGDGTHDCQLVDAKDGMVYAALTYRWGETQKVPSPLQP